MEYNQVSPEEIGFYFMDILGRKDIIAYDAQEEGIRRSLAVFLPASMNKNVAIMYHFSLDFESKMPEQMKNFFQYCFAGLREHNFEKVFYKGFGDGTELSLTYDILTDVGFEPVVVWGEQLNYRLSDLLRTNIDKKYSVLRDKDYCPITLDTKITNEQRMFMNKFAQNDSILQNAIYDPAYSFLCSRGEKNTGCCCMNKDGNALMLTSFHLFAENKKERQNILRVLLGAVIMKARENLPEDTNIIFVFRRRYDNYVIKKFLDHKEEVRNFQEYTYDL